MLTRGGLHADSASREEEVTGAECDLAGGQSRTWGSRQRSVASDEVPWVVTLSSKTVPSDRCLLWQWHWVLALPSLSV